MELSLSTAMRRIVSRATRELRSIPGVRNVSAHLGRLQAGQNILAIHALNESTGSSDFLMQARIVAGFDEGGGGGVGGIEYTGPITLTGPIDVQCALEIGTDLVSKGVV